MLLLVNEYEINSDLWHFPPIIDVIKFVSSWFLPSKSTAFQLS